MLCIYNIVAYLLHARTVEPQKARNTVHYATIDEAAFIAALHSNKRGAAGHGTARRKHRFVYSCVMYRVSSFLWLNSSCMQ
jgi:hypothetical protein